MGQPSSRQVRLRKLRMKMGFKVVMLFYCFKMPILRAFYSRFACNCTYWMKKIFFHHLNLRKSSKIPSSNVEVS